MSRLTRGLIVFGAVLLLLGTARHAGAQVFDLTWTGAYGPGSATLTATYDSSNEYTVTAITGTQNGSAIGGLATYGGNDNAIYNPGAPGQLDFAGLAFSVGGTDYNLFFSTGQDGLLDDTYYECNSTVAIYCTGEDVTNGVAVTSLDITSASATPEPASFLLFGTGLLGITFIMRKRLA